MTIYDQDDRVVLRLSGNPGNRYFHLPEIHARRIGIVRHPNPERPWQMILTDDADPDALVELPNGVRFTLYDLTCLSAKSEHISGGWEIWMEDPGGFPPEHFDEKDGEVAS